MAQQNSPLRLPIAVLALLVVWAVASLFARTSITTCEIKKDEGVNYHSEITYYTCGSTAAFIVVTDSVGDLILRDHANQLVEVHIERVK